MTDAGHRYHPIYRTCIHCGTDQNSPREYCQPRPVSAAPSHDRMTALREARELIRKHAISAWRGGLVDRSDGITEVLVDFDLKFPEARP